MPHRLSDVLSQRSSEMFVGRDEEIAILLDALEGDGPAVFHVHGMAGVGKSALLTEFAGRARARGATVVQLDCRSIEPTERGFLTALNAAIGHAEPTVEDTADRLGSLGPRVLLALDTYEVFRLLDTWLRQRFIPALTDNVRVVCAGRQPPGPAWLVAQEWQGLFRSLVLGPISDEEATQLLAQGGVPARDARRINGFARGHPLALMLAAAAVLERPGVDVDDVAISGVVQALTQVYLSDVADPATRQVVEAGSLVRRVTRSLLGAMLPDSAPEDAYDRLRGLPFVESRSDGLGVHDAVRDAVSAALHAADPQRHQSYRRAAWRQLRAELRAAPPGELWRYTADIIYLQENPVVREAFFPTGSQEYAVEPARPADHAEVRALTAQHEGSESAALLEEWWQRAPQAFHVVRDRENVVTGVYCLFDPETVPPDAVRADDVTRGWWQHLERDPVPRYQRVLFLRRWLSLEHGEVPSPVQGACWLDVKRAYVELRPHLRRVYLTVCDLPTYAPVATKLGFRPLPDTDVVLDEVTYQTAVLDFGPASVDGWLARLAAAELGVDDDSDDSDLLDHAAHALVVNGERVRLTPLEFETLSYLCQREGKVVSRDDLLENVWGNIYYGSNVVDVVVRSLRKKLGEHASMIETVRGVGYRLLER